MASLSTLRTQVRRLILEQDTTNTHFPDAELNDYLNQAIQFLGTQMEWPFVTSTATAIQSQELYAVPDDFIALVEAYFDNTKLLILERDDMSGVSTSWQEDPDGKPRIAYRADQSTIGLYPAPDSVNAGLTIQMQYIQIPATLTQDTDVPNLHAAYQICLPFYAAFLCEVKLGNDKKADMNLSRFDQHRKALMSRIQKFSDESFRFRWTFQYPERRIW